jgi:hypothetical protein
MDKRQLRPACRAFVPWIALGVSFWLCSVTLADETGSDAGAPPAPGSGDYAVRIAIDPAQGEERQLAEARRIAFAADRGDSYAQYVIGSLYRLGKRHPAALYERDDHKAEIYLSNAAAHGQVYAMAGMAELELLRKHPMEAMVWSQVFALYESVLVHASDDQPSRQAYAAYLIQRADEKLGHDDEVRLKIQSHFLAFQQQHDATIRAALLEHGNLQSGTAEPGLEMLNARDRYLGEPNAIEERMKTPGHAVFLLGVDTQGKVQTELVLDSLPDALFAQGLARNAKRLHFNSAPDGTALRWAILPIAFDNFTLRLEQRKE